jgi:predicted enzyme involved in methoxymalonyl-ACP biosynthesis
LADRLGDNGLISIIFLKKSGASAEIDTWLMSCRVLQRTVEPLALNEIVRLCREQGCTAITGVYIPTERNGMVRGHYPSLGFDAAGAEGDITYWRLDAESYEPRQTYIIDVERNHGRNARTLTAGFSAGV